MLPSLYWCYTLLGFVWVFWLCADTDFNPFTIWKRVFCLLYILLDGRRMRMHVHVQLFFDAMEGRVIKTLLFAIVQNLLTDCLPTSAKVV